MNNNDKVDQLREVGYKLMNGYRSEQDWNAFIDRSVLEPTNFKLAIVTIKVMNELNKGTSCPVIMEQLLDTFPLKKESDKLINIVLKNVLHYSSRGAELFHYVKHNSMTQEDKELYKEVLNHAYEFDNKKVSSNKR